MCESRIMKDYIDKNKRPVLDLGCGDGTFAKSLELEDIYALDSNSDLVNRINQNNTFYKEAFHADAAHIPFEDNFFMTVLSNCAVEHMDNIGDVLKEVRRVLNENGEFIFSVPTERFFHLVRQDEALNSLKLNDQQSIKKYNEFHHHVNIFDVDFWGKMLKDAEFEFIKYRYYLPDFIAAFIARMDMLYSIGGPERANIIRALTTNYSSSQGLALRQYFNEYLTNPQNNLQGTHLIIKAIKYDKK